MRIGQTCNWVMSLLNAHDFKHRQDIVFSREHVRLIEFFGNAFNRVGNAGHSPCIVLFAHDIEYRKEVLGEGGGFWSEKFPGDFADTIRRIGDIPSGPLLLQGLEHQL
jgi:hypothetical protein